MSTFSKSQYIWLESFFRDEVHRTNIDGDYEKKSETRIIILNLCEALYEESPNGFNKKRFLDAIYKSPIKIEEYPDVTKYFI
jgi:hypothetical protein